MEYVEENGIIIMCDSTVLQYKSQVKCAFQIIYLLLFGLPQPNDCYILLIERWYWFYLIFLRLKERFSLSLKKNATGECILTVNFVQMSN